MYVSNPNINPCCLTFSPVKTRVRVHTKKGAGALERSPKKNEIEILYNSIIKTLNLDEEKIIEAISVGVLDSNKSIQFITNRGIIKKSSLNNFQTNYTLILFKHYISFLPGLTRVKLTSIAIIYRPSITDRT